MIVLILAAITLMSSGITFLVVRHNIHLRAEIMRVELEKERELQGFARLCIETTDRMRAERDNAVDNLAVVLQADPIPFNHVAVELGLNGVVYQFHSLEDKKEITA